MKTTIVISRTIYADPAKAELERGVIDLCRAEGFDVIVTPHLYHIAHVSPVWDTLREIPGGITLAMWLHPRPAEALAAMHGLGAKVQRAFNLGAYEGADACFSDLRDGISPGEGTFTELDAPVLERWYPVVDMPRCVNCRHCLQFCLFGVHALDADGQVRVTYPDKCKPGCPACSRICPEGAIIFPLYERDEAIAGAPGLLMQPDADARRMFYKRTGKLCPTCGQNAKTAIAPQVALGIGKLTHALCEECGSALPDALKSPEPSPVQDELDALLNELDDITRSNS